MTFNHPRMNRLMSRNEVASMLGVSNGTVDNYVKRRLIRRYIVKATGRRVFKRAEIEAFLNDTEEIIEDPNV